MRLFKYGVRILSFFGKELSEMRRQPRLVLSLMLGPLLILLMFGAGYRSDRPILRTAIVVPPERQPEINTDAISQISNANFDLVSIDSDLEGAMARLNRGELDVVEVLPADIQERASAGEQSAVQFTYNEVNPVNEQWIQYLGYAQVVEINKAILQNVASSLQGEAETARVDLADTRSQLEQAEAGLDDAQTTRLRESLRRVRQASGVVAASAALAGDSQAARARNDLAALQDDLAQLDTALAEGRLDQERARIQSTRERVTRFEELAGQVSKVPPQVLVSPLTQDYKNLSGRSFDLMVYYAPGVLALLIQHTAITLGALSLVRERLIGADELFRVAPVQASHMLIGKYAAYTLFIAILSLALVVLMSLIGVPLPARPLAFAGLALLLTLASLGIGFLISALSQTDSQAVQLSMLMLLLSIFFSGFFLPLENFWLPMRVLGYTLPMTHGLQSFQTLLLRGSVPPQFAWSMLGLIAAASAAVSLILTRRSLRKI